MPVRTPRHVLPVVALLLAQFLLPCLAGSASAQTRAPGEWQTLFDGRTTRGWRGFRMKDFPAQCWAVEDGVLRRRTGPDVPKDFCRDLITTSQYTNFEFEVEYRLAPGGNSGVKYLVVEQRPQAWDREAMEYQVGVLRKEAKPGWEKEAAGETVEKYSRYAIGFEFQLIDDAGHPDALRGTNRTTGALYDLLAPARKAGAAAGAFNRARLVVDNGHVEHWINGVKVLEFELGGAALRNAIAKSKFARLESFGAARKGHIVLQDHQDDVRFRSLRIRELKSNTK
jgi:hypothetical protein